MIQRTIEGKVYIFGDNIDTDQIYPGRYLELTDPKEIASHTMEGIESNFSERFDPESIIVAGKNFGCGSSREHAPIALSSLQASIVIAESFARIFFRNAINLGLPLMICPDISKKCKETDELKINLESGEIENVTTGEKLKGEAFSKFVFEILDNGGIKPMLKKKSVEINT